MHARCICDHRARDSACDCECCSGCCCCILTCLSVHCVCVGVCSDSSSDLREAGQQRGGERVWLTLLCVTAVTVAVEERRCCSQSERETYMRTQCTQCTPNQTADPSTAEPSGSASTFKIRVFSAQHLDLIQRHRLASYSGYGSILK